MSEPPTASRWQDAGPYEIRLKGHLETRWAAWFDGLSLIHENDGTTVLHGPIVDQAGLHGLLQRVRDLGLPLISVTQLDADPTPDSHRCRPSLPDGCANQEGPSA